MKKMNGIPEGNIVAIYKKGKSTLTCRISGDFYYATFNVTNRTYYSKDKNEIFELIKKKLADGFVSTM